MAESPIEQLFREASGRLWPDTPPLVQEYPVMAGGRAYRLDFAVPSLRKGIELDGHATHSSPEDIARDRRRKRDLEDAGWQVRYYGGREVTEGADQVVRDALAWCGLEPRVHKRSLSVPQTTSEAIHFARQQHHYDLSLWECRKLCLRALVASITWPTTRFDAPAVLKYHATVAFNSLSPIASFYGHRDLRELDDAGYWDLYENRYLYTNCVQESRVLRFCPHECLDESKSGCHCAKGVHCPNDCGHQWYTCGTCSVCFPWPGQEQAWLDCAICEPTGETLPNIRYIHGAV